MRFGRFITILITAIGLAHCAPDPASDASLFSRSGSAERLPGESYRDAEARFALGLASGDLDSYNSIHSAKSLASPFASHTPAWFNAVPTFASYADLLEAFTLSRDERTLVDPEHPGISRRPTWLYPDDGCYARADLLTRSIGARGHPRPSKLFAFGTLAMSTPNTPSGLVTWWYHVAPIVKVNDVTYVLDPAVSPIEPITVETWMNMIALVPNEIEIAVCNSFSYIPQSRCHTATDTGAERAIIDQVEFLTLERDRLESLDRDAESELGEHPPWR